MALALLLPFTLDGVGAAGASVPALRGVCIIRTSGTDRFCGGFESGFTCDGVTEGNDWLFFEVGCRTIFEVSGVFDNDRSCLRAAGIVEVVMSSLCGAFVEITSSEVDCLCKSFGNGTIFKEVAAGSALRVIRGPFFGVSEGVISGIFRF